MNEGEEWKVLRRYSMSNMRDFGMGKLSLQGKIHEEIFHLFEEIEVTDGHSVPFNPRSVLSAATTNVLCNIMCGHRFDYKDREFKGLVESIYSALSEGYVGFITWFPIFRFIPPFKKAMDYMWDNTYYIWNFSSNLIRSAKKAMDAGEEETTLLQSIVNEAKKSDPARAAVFNKNILYNTCQLYLAGAETTSTSLEWCCYWMLLKPELQKRMQDEIDKNIDPSCLPRIEDKSKLPLAEAFSLEILRMCPPLPLGVPHATTSETWFRGYRIPERTIVFSHLAGLQQDPKLFDEPNKFNPDRFIDKNGKVDYRKTGFVPFGVGKRQCLGEALARMELFCFLTSILQNYNVVCPPGQHLEIPERIKTGITCHPPNFEMLLQPRYTNKEEFSKRLESVN
jgi:cytochrome P450